MAANLRLRHRVAKTIRRFLEARFSAYTRLQ